MQLIAHETTALTELVEDVRLNHLSSAAGTYQSQMENGFEKT